MEWLSQYEMAKEQQFMKCGESSASFLPINIWRLYTWHLLSWKMSHISLAMLICWRKEVQEFLRLQPTVSELLFCLFVFIFAYLSRFKCCKYVLLCFLWLQVAHEGLNALFSVLEIHRSLNTAINMLLRKQSWDVITLACKKTIVKVGRFKNQVRCS